MLPYLLKTLASAAVLVAVAEIAKRAPAIGGLLIALPLGTLIAVALMAHDGTPRPQITAFVWSILLLVRPTIVFFRRAAGRARMELACLGRPWRVQLRHPGRLLAVDRRLKALGITLQFQA